MDQLGEVRKSIVRIRFKISQAYVPPPAVLPVAPPVVVDESVVGAGTDTESEEKKSTGQESEDSEDLSDNDGFGSTDQDEDINNNDNTIDMVVPGVIILMDDEVCEILAGNELINLCSDDSYHFSFPLEGQAYAEEFILEEASSKTSTDYFCKFVVSMGGIDTQYIKEVKFEISDLRKSQQTIAGVFPRVTHIAPCDLWPGYVVDPTPKDMFFMDCPFHEYAHFGSPVFNEKGHLIGICFAFQSRIHVWSADRLKEELDDMLGPTKSLRISYV